jgi:anionic cell wall polymer biosynthesis LytR-Cps2A-Psr (LCP) family protein
MKKRRSNLVLKIMFLSLAVAVFFFTAAYLAFPALFFSTPNEIKGGAAAAEKLSSGRVNIVLLGLDRDEIRSKKSKAFRPDTIMIASINFKSKEVSLVSIPRDSYVKIAGTEIMTR